MKKPPMAGGGGLSLFVKFEFLDQSLEALLLFGREFRLAAVDEFLTELSHDDNDVEIEVAGQ